MVTSNEIPLAAKPLDRAGHLRGRADDLDRLFGKDDAVVFLVRAGEPFMTGDGGLVWLGGEAAKLDTSGRRLFLGLDTQGAGVFALDVSRDFEPEGSLVEGAGEFADFYRAMGTLSPLELNLASTARSIFEWHRSHRFCAACGSESEVTEAGWKSVCPACSREHFPRTDPVAIMLATRGDKCLLGRQKSWPPGFWSCLAGFIEPGESLEQGAARELHEEAGIVCDPARAEYLFCQPWPFPSSLMIGMLLPADSEQITVDKTEIEDAIWVPRSEIRAMLDGTHETFVTPPSFAVAHHILRAWADRDD